ncbi:Cryptochrome/photolyase, N-terminal domain superfamily [Sesbania bispinosa]|nr:Cryptochrome/photolyase, N-terminal domain superfamily [Sesbania bispinosa]
MWSFTVGDRHVTLAGKCEGAKRRYAKRVSDLVTVHEVDAHNVVPIWVASDKVEYSAKTIRGKINKRLSEYLIDFPNIEPPTRKWVITEDHSIDWDDLIADVLRKRNLSMCL